MILILIFAVTIFSGDRTGDHGCSALVVTGAGDLSRNGEELARAVMLHHYAGLENSEARDAKMLGQRGGVCLVLQAQTVNAVISDSRDSVFGIGGGTADSDGSRLVVEEAGYIHGGIGSILDLYGPTFQGIGGGGQDQPRSFGKGVAQCRAQHLYDASGCDSCELHIGHGPVMSSGRWPLRDGRQIYV